MFMEPSHAHTHALWRQVGLTLEYHAALKRLRRGDFFIWVGIHGKLSQPWKQLSRERGIRT